MGVDVARGGPAQTVIAKRYGHWFAPLIKVPGRQTSDGPSVAALVFQEYQPGCAINIDLGATAGGGAYESLRYYRAIQDPMNPINNAQSVDMRDRSGKYRLVNVRAASYWKLRECLDPVHAAAVAHVHQARRLEVHDAPLARYQGDGTRDVHQARRLEVHDAPLARYQGDGTRDSVGGDMLAVGSIITATPVTGFVMEARTKRASFRIGFFVLMSIRPVASKYTTRPLRATRATAPEILLAAIWQIGARDRAVGKSAGCGIGGNVRARWSRARFVIGGAEGIVRFCRRHRSPSFEQPSVEGGLSGRSEVWREKNAL
jgi:hypothetical protein